MASQNLSEEHRRLERVFETLISVLPSEDPRALRAEWNHFEAELLQHLELEERELLPAFAYDHRADVEALLREHEQIRSALTDLGVRLDLHCLRAEDVLAFIERLRTHAANEDAGFYRWLEARASSVACQGA